MRRRCALLLAVPLTIPWRRSQLAAGVAIATGLAVASLAAFGAEGLPIGSVFEPGGRAERAGSDVNTATSPHAAIASDSHNLQLLEAVPLAIVGALDNHCVETEPVEVSAIVAYPQWRWCPIGVMQSYAAYTTKLDNLDAAGYADARHGPDRVLRENGAIDARNPTWESPAAMLALLCHFREIGRGGQWQALARIPIAVAGRACSVPSIATAATSSTSRRRRPGTCSWPRSTDCRSTTRTAEDAVRARRRAKPGDQQCGHLPRGPGHPDRRADPRCPRFADYAPPFNFNLAVGTIEAEIDQALSRSA